MTYNLRTETVPIFYLALKNQIEPKFPFPPPAGLKNVFAYHRKFHYLFRLE